MVFRQSRVGGECGYTLVELMTALAVIGIVSMVATPLFMTFLRAMETRGASQELATVLQQARELAIARNTNYQINVNGNQLQFWDTSTNQAWVGPGTDNQGFRRLVNQAQLVDPPANPIIFNPLGTARGGTITVQNAQDNTSSLDVIVATSGRVRIN
ncbi:MAG: type II secretion system protein GspH [Candidatus Methylomirabilis oxygeniifera]|uniref:Putative Type IV pilus biogenesis protein n=1 Tax=Methylomirabilis oxygeniifera TaxID=671143 RepID=D5MMF7_METO1|nr:MAG: type II secretion system protein GspH [Candidatus Methylomirabilis oxyfera]CBE70079.1 putative Type IV pilus biogenesis protein [Candidatus Methylomirabilis oxyfera]